jgi:hypothetical protein
LLDFRMTHVAQSIAAGCRLLKCGVELPAGQGL